MTVSRRRLLGLSAAAGLAWETRAAAAPLPGPTRVHMDTDGVDLTPQEFADLLQRLAGGVTPDEYSLGGEVEKLETQFAKLLGKEQAVFLPSGTLANQLAVRRLAKGRSRVIVQEISHLYNDSGDCAERLSGLNLVPLAPGKATFTRDDVERTIARTAASRVTTGVGVISIESPVRRLHGELFDLAQMRSISALAREQGIGLHLDGARLFAASAYSGVSPQDYASLFDTVYVSLWKCFSSGSGAILAGPRAELADLYQTRRMFGGALFSAWPFAAVASHYADGLLDRLRAAVRACDALDRGARRAGRPGLRARPKRLEQAAPDRAGRRSGGLPGEASRTGGRPTGARCRRLLADRQRNLDPQERPGARRSPSVGPRLTRPSRIIWCL